MKRLAILLAYVLSACTSAVTPPDPRAGKTGPAPAPTEATKPVVAQAEPPAKAAEPAGPETVAPPPGVVYIPEDPPPPEVALPPEAPPSPETAPPPEALPPPAEIAIQPWAPTAYAATWTLHAEPAEPLALVDLLAGVLGRAGNRWYQLGADGQLAVIELETEPKPPIFGVWPSDAWYVDLRFRKLTDDPDTEYHEIRLMKLRGGKRWAPQVYSGGGGEQWFHPGTDHEIEPHISARSGMLMYPDTFESITRVAGKHDDPIFGSHRGNLIEFFEVGSGKIYVLTHDEGGYYAQTECWDDACVATAIRKLPMSQWKFGRKASRGKFSVSLLASSEGREFILQHRGKSGGWMLDELPPGESPTGIWASQEGGLWTLTGERLRWYDADYAWHEVALPAGLTGPSLALSEDRKQLFVSGVVGGAPKLFTTPANAQAPAPGSPGN